MGMLSCPPHAPLTWIPLGGHEGEYPEVTHTYLKH